MVNNDIVKTSFSDLKDGQRLFELCGGAAGYGMLIQIHTHNKTVKHSDLVHQITQILKSTEQGKFYERIEDEKWQRVPGGEYKEVNK